MKVGCVTNFILFWQKNTDFAQNRHFCYQFRIVLAKECRFRTKSSLVLPISYCFGKRMPISHKIVTFVTNFVLFWQKNADFAQNRHLCYQFRIVLAKECRFRTKSSLLLPISYCFGKRMPISHLNIMFSVCISVKDDFS